MKSSKVFVLPLSPQAIDIIEALPKEYAHLFVSTHHNPERKPISGFGMVKAELDKLSGVTNWRYHDLRRTAASGMSMLGTPPHVVDAVLAHSAGNKVRRVYLRYDYLHEKRKALEGWANYVQQLVS